VIVAIGAEPAVALGGRVLFGVRREAFSVGIDVRIDAPASQSVGPGSIRASLVAGSVVPCYHYRVFAGCAVLGAGALHSEGQGFTEARTATTAVFLAGARLGVEIPLYGVLFFHLHGDLLVPLSRTTVQVNQSEVWRSPPLSGVIGIGLGVNFQ